MNIKPCELAKDGKKVMIQCSCTRALVKMQKQNKHPFVTVHNHFRSKVFTHFGKYDYFGAREEKMNQISEDQKSRRGKNDVKHKTEPESTLYNATAVKT